MNTTIELSMPTPSPWTTSAAHAIEGVSYPCHAPFGATNGTAPALQVRVGGMKTRDAVATRGRPRGIPH